MSIHRDLCSWLVIFMGLSSRLYLCVTAYGFTFMICPSGLPQRESLWVSPLFAGFLSLSVDYVFIIMTVRKFLTVLSMTECLLC